MATHGSHRVLDRRHLTEHTFVLRTTRPEGSIAAGQCFSVGTSDLAINREYSMYSAEGDPFVDFLIRVVDQGAVSTALSRLDEGDDVEVGGPYGSFCLDQNQVNDSPFVFIASGTGIAPFASYVKTYPNLNYTILHGVRYESELYDREIYRPGNYVPCVSRPESGSGRRVTEALGEMDLDPSALFYLCGNRNMITDVIQVLRDKRIPGGQIFMETFF